MIIRSLFTESRTVATLIALTVLFVGLDLGVDSRAGAPGWHLVLEGLIGLSVGALGCVVVRRVFRLRTQLERERGRLDEIQKYADGWRAEAEAHIFGLNRAIDSQMTKWMLTPSEKEVAFLLLRGLSSKEVAEARKTSEKTARAQSMAIYSKAGLKNRSELAAFFLKDLLESKHSM